MAKQDQTQEQALQKVGTQRPLSPLHLVVRDWVVRQYALREGAAGWLAVRGRHLPGQVPIWEGRLPSRDSKEAETFDADDLVRELLECCEGDADAHKEEPGATGFWVYYLHFHAGESQTPSAMTSFKVYCELPTPEIMTPGRGTPNLVAGAESETLVRQVQVHLENRDKIGLSERALQIQGVSALLGSYQAALSRHEAREAAHFTEMRYAADRRNELEMVLFHESQENTKNRQLGAHLADVVSKFVQLWTANEMLKKQGKGIG